ncbi:sodium ABC transporter permease [Serinibacter arcticus]|uniref:Sodium ABC transporter permease n=1 Tax=Serinibacter arcticus TaxID=1655435 RepID=A0A2U1ZTS8_9MICO|nr:ABC transporter permease [Serinibacter arcticus]PWD50388.1 sodium ABC transporter permease [Serinibacter arcticus]
MSTQTTPATTGTNPGTAPGSTSGPRGSRLSFGRASLLVAEREISTQVRTKSFIISNLVTLLLILGGIVGANLIGDRLASGGEEATRVAVVSQTQDAVAGIDTLEGVSVADRAAAEELVRSGDVEAALIPDRAAPLGFTVLALEEAPGAVVSQLSVSPEVELLEPQPTSSALRSLIPLAFGLVFMMAALGSGAVIMQNTVQEKQSRVVEILLAAVPAKALLAGKILGNSVIGVATAALTAATAALGLAITGQTALLDVLSAPLIWFVVFFLVGFVLVASMFAAGASLVSRQEDTGAVMMPAMTVLMVPYFGVIFFADNATVMTVLSYVPFSAPVAMPVRLFFGEATWWEPLLALGILAATTALVMVLASKIYTNSLLRMGSRVPLREALRGS